MRFGWKQTGGRKLGRSKAEIVNTGTYRARKVISVNTKSQLPENKFDLCGKGH